MALPAEFEEVEPAFYHHPKEELPTVNLGHVRVRVMIGSAYGVSSPVKRYGGALYLEAHLRRGQTLTLPPAPERGLYVVSGSVQLDEQVVAAHSMAVLSPASDGTLTAHDDAIVALVGGDPMPHRFLEWNFVSSRQERILEAKEDWWAGRFPSVPGDDVEFIPLPD
ncbi:MAG: hypothetical protein RJA70_4803 [Pseudomonadota bacterium]|jgi:redox-sensitive bicupin YhaK (pirin superfamily)